ncbi:Ankyrin repeats protein [Novymonas esmeraldas]|uniref:Ankyrin repeats protein n=1 Tax=Novymonas esmeraldas TaxID=1808958 RepID=A0AAW0ENJ4_9TRYP
MRQWIERVCDQQVGLDEYLPGTPHPEHRPYRDLAETFPYHVMGRSSSVLSAAEVQRRSGTAAERRFREQDAVRRRQHPSCFEEACAYGNLQAAVLMWSQGAVDIATRRAIYEGNSASALMWAALKGHLAIVRFLVDHGAPLEAVNALGHTALQWAVTSGHADVVRYLLDRGADAGHRDRQGFDSAFAAVQNDRLAILLVLTEDTARDGALLQTSDDGMVFYRPAAEQLTRAATCVNPRTQKPYYLLDPTLRDVEGHSLLHWAAYRNSAATCQYLIDHWGYAVDVADSHGRTPLVWAAREGFAEVVELLLSRGADRDAVDGDAWTALQHARARNHAEATYVLESYPTANQATLDHGEDAAKVAGHRPSGGRYVCVRDCRAAGTLRMMHTHPTFAVMALAGPLYIAVTAAIMAVLPPIASYFPFGVFFFKNVVWTALMSRPTQTSRTASTALSLTRDLGIAANIADSVRGTWRYRLREPMCMFLWLTFLAVQVWAWNSMGLVPLFSSSDSVITRGGAAAVALWGTSVAPTAPQRQPLIHFFGLSLVRRLTLQANPLDGFQPDSVIAAIGAAAATPAFVAAETAYMAQSNSLVRWVLMLLLLGCLVCAVLCKLLSHRSMMRPASEEGTLRTSPLWRIVKARQYRWLHPRFFMQERHMQLPLRAFYCHERDVVVRGYDGYSTLLDCPIGRANHLAFVLTLTLFALFELLLCVWGLQQTRVLLRCPARVSWYHGAFDALQPDDVLAERVLGFTPMSTAALPRGRVAALAAGGQEVVDTSSPQAVATALLAAAAPVVSFAWLSTAAEVLLHGLPCRQYHVLDSITRDYLASVGTPRAAASPQGAADQRPPPPPTYVRYVRRGILLFRYYLWPTRASMLGVWILQYSALAAFAIGCVAVRQWVGVWYGATRIELANPLAQGSGGELVSLFPPEPQKARRVALVDEEEERYYRVVCPSKARCCGGGDAVAEEGRCLYADGNGLVNVLSFLLGRNGRRWVGAMTVSPHNTPVKTPMLL